MYSDCKLLFISFSRLFLGSPRWPLVRRCRHVDASPPAHLNCSIDRTYRAQGTRKTRVFPGKIKDKRQHTKGVFPDLSTRESQQGQLGSDFGPVHLFVPLASQGLTEQRSQASLLTALAPPGLNFTRVFISDAKALWPSAPGPPSFRSVAGVGGPSMRRVRCLEEPATDGFGDGWFR